MRTLPLILVLVLILSGCGSDSATEVIALSHLEPLPATAPADIVPLRVAVAAVISPRGTIASYQPLLDYMSDRLHRPIELVQRRTYGEINDLVATGEVDIAFVCTGAYVVGRQQGGMELLVAPQVNGAALYYSYLIVPAGSPANSLADLRGKVFAFTDPMSTTGRLYPTSLVQTLGETPDTFFARTFFTYSHDKAIEAVANGVADGAAVDSLVYDFAVSRDPSLAQKVRIIHRSPAFGTPPVVVTPSIRPQLRAELEDLLLSLPDTATGRAALTAIGVDRFVPVSDRDYDSVRALVLKTGFNLAASPGE
ncbi:MAG: phosphate/phosphite/phosphonate ABC transporter substrate-binding protein [Anaerolineae bacterium]